MRKAYYWLAPAIVMIPSLLTVAIIPFGSQIGAQKMVIADLNVGILYTFGIVSLGVYGIVLAGYAAQVEIPFHRRHPLQRADDLLRDRDGPVGRPAVPDRRRAGRPAN